MNARLCITTTTPRALLPRRKLHGGPRVKPLAKRLTRVRASSDTARVTVKPETKKQYAVLHDFCMSIPYGAVVAVVGLGGMALGQGTLAAATALAGIGACVSSALSLKAWKTGQSNTRYTLASSGLAMGAGTVSWRAIQNGGAGVVAKVTVTLSAMMVVFLIYNIVAGGNPPKKARSSS